MGDGMLSLYWNNHKATFCHILATLREKERYTDATLACDGKFYPVHKLVLSTCSEYFENMFEHTPCKHPVIVLKDVKHDEVEALLSYMYAGVVSVAQNDLARLIKAAEMLQIKGLAVPDEPPSSEENRKPSYNRREERPSPQPKRRRREENGAAPQGGGGGGGGGGGSQPSSSPPSSPRASPYQEPDAGRRRTHSETQQRLEPRVTDQQDTSQHEPSDIKQPIIVDETLVKEEMVETVDSSQSDPGLDPGLHFGHVGSDAGMDGTSQDSHHMLPNQSVMPGQPIADAVAEALAGPSGMQGWLGSDIGAFGGESYNADGSDVTSNQAHAQQRVGSESGSLWDCLEGVPRLGYQGFGELLQCLHCDFSTSVEARFTRHARLHNEEKPFACGQCRYRSDRKGNLEMHMRTHTGERPFHCTFCPLAFTLKHHLKRHLQTHTGAFPCPYCAFRAESQDTLKTHIGVRHKQMALKETSEEQK